MIYDKQTINLKISIAKNNTEFQNKLIFDASTPEHTIGIIIYGHKIIQEL